MPKPKNKQKRRREFELRHVDQLWRDVRRPKEEVCDGVKGPVGTTDKVEMDEDIPGRGKHYCVPCSRYFITGASLVKHEKSKPHKKLVKLLANAMRPHDQRAAEQAGGMGKPDNGISARMPVDS
ncbi:hypothetical protein BSKO_11080 [Bryopsis sp. KO-2023]|nr:hypothetical protein BSKO_11080 [Bryopsis sp. KO-2023]